MPTDIPVLFEDQWLLAVNKPAGLPTQPTLDRKRESLYQLLLDSKKWPYLALHHRLDAPTSGVVIFAKSKDINKELGELFSKIDSTLQKNYLCIAKWKVDHEVSFVVKNHLKAMKGGNQKTKMQSTKSGGDCAETLFKVLEHYPASSTYKEPHALLEAKPQTGRMHQIRIHLAELGMPILGDALYYRADRKIPRLLLHAHQLEFVHPKTKKQLSIVAPLPDDFQGFVNKLKQ